jgi:hypothetical protein
MTPRRLTATGAVAIYNRHLAIGLIGAVASGGTPI